ncbi:unnamed protein product [Dracunculus medinensis]|uniref:Uncharacterized protein n=1 Tax=Dracunculus medinensis TaxID=318479 RepID=A0A0N4U3V3_DRAME|nr:unnamed protein product [Dracunculus medinensis]
MEKTEVESQKLQPLINLPKLQLMKFDGSIRSWVAFKDNFLSTIGNRNLDPVDKLRYLISCLEGEAKELVEGFPMDDESYRNLWEILENRYGDKSIIIEELYKELRELNPKTKDIKEIRKDLERIFRQLISLGEDINNNSILSMAQAKLPIFVLKRVLEEKRKCSTWDISESRNVMKTCEEEKLLLSRMISSGDKEKLQKHKTINNFKKENRSP